MTFIPAQQAPQSRGLAQLLIQQAQNRPDYSNIRSPLEGLAKMGTEWVNAYSAKKGNQAMDERQMKANADMARALQAGMGSPAGLDKATGITWDSAVNPDKNAMIQMLMQNPDNAELGQKLALGQMGNIGSSSSPSSVQEWEYFNKLPPQQKSEYLGMKRAAQTLNLGGEQVRLSPTGGIQERYAVTPKPEQMPEFQANQQRAKDLAEAENAQLIASEKSLGQQAPERQKQQQARSRVTGNLNKMAKSYNELKELGGVIDTGNSALSNVGARIASSELGQAASGAVGSKTQSIRNQIEMMRPNLINDIRQASQMGAKGMDSEKELEFFLQAVTDPKRDIQSNMAALSAIDQAYGLGANTVSSKEAMDALRKEFQDSVSSGQEVKAPDAMTNEELLKALGVQ